MNQARTADPRTVQPAAALRCIGSDDRTEGFDACGAQAAVAERGTRQRIVSRRAIDEPVDKRRRIHCSEQVGCAASEQLVPFVVCDMMEGKARRHDAVEESLEQGREGAPPSRIYEPQVLRPRDVVLGAYKVRFQRLQLGRRRVDIRIESHLTQNQLTALHACLPRPPGVGIEECTTQAVATRMGENQ